MTKKLLALVLAMIMCFCLLASCGGQGTPSATPTQTKTPTPTPTPDQKDGGEDEPAGLTLPLVDKLTTFKGWMAGPWSEAGMVDANDSAARKKIEEMTNVHMEWQHPMSGQETTSFNLMIASGEYPDLICGAMMYFVGGPDRYVDLDIVVDLKEYVEDYAPNYMERRLEDTYFQYMSVTDMGRMPMLRHLKIDAQPSYQGRAARGDWLENLGMKNPVTYGDWTTMLTAFRDECGADLVMQVTNTGMDGSFLSTFGIIDGFVQDNGIVKYGPQLPEFKEYVTQLHEWYAAGLIDPDFFGRGGNVDSSHLTTGRLGSYIMVYTYIDYYQKQIEDPAASIVPLTAPVKNAGDTRSVVYGSAVYRVGGATASISTNCKNIPLLLSYLDFFYSDEGSRLANYGILGESYELDASGNPKFMDIVAKNPDGLALNHAIAKYAIHHSQPFWYDWKRELTDAMSDKAKGAGDVWDANYVERRSMPEVTLTSDESTEYSIIYNDISTMVKEFAVKFITTPGAIESEYDTFLSEMERMGIDKAIAAQQAALTRYNARQIG